MTQDPHGRERKSSSVRDWWIQRLITLYLPAAHTGMKKIVSEILSFCFKGNQWYSFYLCLAFSLFLLFSVSLSPSSGPICASISCQYLTLLPPTCSPTVTMDNMSGWLWQIKATRYMAITFTGWHGRGGGSWGVMGKGEEQRPKEKCRHIL